MGRFPQIARSSASETEYHLLLARDLGFLSDVGYSTTTERLVEVQRMLTSLVQVVRPAAAFEKPQKG
jgi:four helix bundle protein